MKTYKIHKKDTVIVALSDLQKDDIVNDDITLLSDIPFGHKIANEDIKKGSEVIKYGYPIGIASMDISKGCHVHSKNLQSNISIYDHKYEKAQVVEKKPCQKTFHGIKRKNGQFGTRNYLYVIATVGCINVIVNKLADMYNRTEHTNVDRIVPIVHQFGCSQLGDDHENTANILCNLAYSPNCGGVLVVGLGCENNNIDTLTEKLQAVDKERIEFLNCQDFENEFAEGGKKIEKILAVMKNDTREETSIDDLVIGVKCGGSDGLSGITANPIIGRVCDFITTCGGTVIMTEVPEMFGAETSILERCKNKDVFYDTVKMINDFKQYFLDHNMPVNENPSPGNKAGGITTLEEKALGCTQKSGMSEVVAVLNYHERVSEKGLNLLSAPGNDIIAVSALASAGANIILFSTGRGTPLGAVVPVVKISSNNYIAEKKQNWIDYDASGILENENCTEDFITSLISYANGEKTKAEKIDAFDFAIFKNGITL